MCNVQTGGESIGGNMSGWKNDGREYVRVKETTGGNMSRVSKMTGGNMSRREFVRIPSTPVHREP